MSLQLNQNCTRLTNVMLLVAHYNDAYLKFIDRKDDRAACCIVFTFNQVQMI